MFTLLAQQKAAGSPFDRPELIWGSIGLAAALFVGAMVIFFVDRWRKRDALAEREPGVELTDYRAMFESGQITREEYEKLRLKVANRVKPAEAAPAESAENPPAQPPVPGPFPPGYFDDPPPLPK